MAFRSRSFSPSRLSRGGPRRKTLWGQSGEIGEVTIANNTKVLVSRFTSATLEPIVPFTIVRTRGLISVRSDQAAGTEPQVGAFGIAVVSEDAAVAGAVSIPRFN